MDYYTTCYAAVSFKRAELRRGTSPRRTDKGTQGDSIGLTARRQYRMGAPRREATAWGSLGPRHGGNVGCGGDLASGSEVSNVATGATGEVELQLARTEVREWDEEDLMGSDLADQLESADASSAAEIISSCSFRLPVDLATRELVGYAAQQGTPLGAEISPDASRFDFHVVSVPVNIVVPPPQRLVRLRLILRLQSDPATEPILAWDLFPTDKVENVDVNIGEASLDISKALAFVCPAPVADVLGLKLRFPIAWKSVNVVIDCSGRMSNPAEWYVNDASISSAFIGYAIVRAPKGSRVSVATELVGEIRRPGPLRRLLKAQFRSATQTYALGSTPG
jgi:hypothetical protein